MKNNVRMKHAIMAMTIAMSCLNVEASYFSVITNDQPAGYWRLNELVTTPGNKATNYGTLGTAATGYYYGNVVANCPGSISAPGDSDKSCGFGLVSNQVVVLFTNSAVLSAFSSKTFSFEAWAKAFSTTPANYEAVLCSRVSSPQSGFVMYAQGNPADWQFWLGTGTAFHTMATTTGGLVNTNWTHVVGTYDGTNQTLYVNGTVLAVAKEPYSPPNATSTFQIGMANAVSPALYPFSTNIDEVAFYTNALTPSQILNHYVAGTGNNPPATVAANVQLFGPTAQTNYLGATAMVQVTAGGTLPFQYQWMYASATNGSATTNNLVGATNAQLVITNLALTNQGAYWIVISNSLGYVTSSIPAWVQVINIASPTITTNPQPAVIYTGGTAHFTLSATGAASFNYQWQWNGTNISGNAGGTNSSLVISNVQPTNVGSYQAFVGDAAGTNMSGSATLSILPAPDSNSYAGVIMTDHPVSYWRLGLVDYTNGGSVAYDLAGGFNGAYVGPVALDQPGAILNDPNSASTTFGNGSTYVDVPFVTNINSPAFTVELWANDNGNAWTYYRAPLANHAPGVYTGYNFYGTPGNDWQFWAGNGLKWNYIGGSTPVMANTWTHLAATYDGTNAIFYVDGIPVASMPTNYAQNATQDLLIGCGGGTGAEAYFWTGGLEEVAIYNTALSSNRIAAHYETGIGNTTPPTITLQPYGGSVLAGSNITLTVSAVGSVPLSYQWQQSGANLAGQTNSSLVLLDFLSTNAVSYDVVVTNDAGSITSSVVDVTAVAVGSSYSSLVLADGAVGYWPLDESSGTVANNLGSSGSADNGTYANGVVLGLAGPIATSSNTCAAFSATNDTDVTLPYDVLLNGQTFSVEAWAQMSGAGQAADDGYQAVYNSRATGYGGVTLYGLYGGDWLAYSGSGSAFTVMDSGVPVQVGKWAHLALTYDGVTQRFYVDGTQVATSAAPFFPDQLYAIQESIGAGGIAPAAEYFFEGNIGEVAVYSTCLPATSIQAHYTVGSTAPYVAPPTISISQSGGNVTLTWSGGALQQSTNLLNGSWSVVSNVVSPLNLEITNTASYYRVMQ